MAVARVLVVDEQAELRAALGTGLARFGFEVVLAAGEADALAELGRQPRVDAILSDVGVAENGLELAVEIIRRHPGVPILLYSGDPLPVQLRDNPRVALVRKPSPIAYLAAGVEDLIEAATPRRSPQSA